MPPSNDVGSPSTAVTNAIIGRKRGTRSNVAVVVSQKRTSDLEDPESFFRNATSAAASPADMAAGDKPLMDIATGKTPNNRVGGRRSNHPRRSLPGQSKENNDMEVQPSKASTRALQAAKEGRLSHISPSDLSLVSTAPPTPASVAAGLKHAGENESPMVTQPVDEEETEEEEEEPTTTTVTLQHQDHITETTRMSHDDNDQDEGDEMIPQPPQEFEQEDDFAVMPNDDDDDDHHHDEGTGFELNNDNSDSQSDVGLPSEIDAEEVSPKKLHSTLKTPGSTKSVDTDDDDDDNKTNDKEDDKANMVHDPETPESVRKERVRREEKHMERKMKARKQNNELSDTETPAKRGRKKKKQRVAFQFSPEGYPIAPREYSSVPVSDLKETPPEGVRRSGRAHHKPLQFWKNERPIYEPHNENGDLGEAMGNMPVVAAYQTALPTPRKKRSVPDSTSGKNDRKGRRHPANDCASAAMDATPFNATKLKRKYHYLDGEEALVYDDATDTVKEDLVVARSRNLERHDLPLPSTRTKAEGKVVARAAQAFNVQPKSTEEHDYVGFIMGHLQLPPKAIKDAESSGKCAHTFTVCHCQPNALEVAYADPSEGEGKYEAETAQRLLLNPGDMFRIPQGNSYRIQNHSTTMDCLLTWTIIKPHSNDS